MDAFALPTFELSLSASGLRDADGRALDIRATLEFARSAEYHAIQLNAADPLTRPRELSRSARRDLAAHIRRHELACSGVDLCIPKAHFSDETKIDRVVGALCDAVQFAADIADLTDGQRLLSIAAPWQAGGAVLAEVAGRAASIGVSIANHAYPWPEDLSAGGPIRVGIDPATVILASADPAQAVSEASASGCLVSARLCDLESSGRVAPGEGSLDMLAYRVAVGTSTLTTPLIIDVRGLPSNTGDGGQLAIARGLVRDLGRARSE
jgi:sugar phosphate isomerase/epimerase